MILASAERVPAGLADEADHREAPGVDVGPDAWPSRPIGCCCNARSAPTLPSTRCAGACGASRATGPGVGRAPGTGASRLPAPRCRAGRGARPRTVRGRTSSSRRTGRPRHHRCRPSAKSIGPKVSVGPGGKRFAKRKPVRARQEVRDGVRFDHRPKSSAGWAPPRSTAGLYHRRDGCADERRDPPLSPGRPPRRPSRGAARAPGRAVFRQARPR